MINLLSLYNTNEVIKHIRAVEASLLDSLDYDQYNSEHIVRLLNIKKCNSLLSNCVLPAYCQSIYINFVYPIYAYLEYTNNFLTIERFNSYMQKDMQSSVDAGREILDLINK